MSENPSEVANADVSSIAAGVIDTNNVQRETKSDQLIPEKSAGNYDPTQNLEWFYDEDIKGEGEAPDWFNAKTFKTVTEQAKAQSELRKMLGDKKDLEDIYKERQSIPEVYSADLGEGYENVKFKSDDPMLGWFNDFCKKSHIPQEKYNDALKWWVDSSREQQSKNQNKTEDALKSLGTTGKQQLDELSAWADNTFGEEKATKYKKLIKDVDGINFMKDIRERLTSNSIPTQNQQTVNVPPPHELREMMKDPKYLQDKDYRRHVDDMYQKRYGGKNYNRHTHPFIEETKS
ncbi:MAG: hypothetical protein B6I17_04160 [Tenericutes bacterium 4572_104]|nr:MAG: hypothetical protein B6I17_04160 [Tenericutes bacterium 4572_104]